MRIGLIIIFVGFLICGLGYAQPHFLPKEAYEVFFGLQLTTIVGFAFGIAGVLVIVKLYMGAR